MRYQLAGFEVDTINRLVTKADHLISIEPQVFNLLVFFCEHSQQPIELKNLSKRFYHEKKVPPSLIADMAKLHYLLEEDPSNPSLLVSIGYQRYQLMQHPIKKASVGLNMNEPITTPPPKKPTQTTIPTYQTKPKAKRKLFAKAMIVLMLIAGGAFVLPWQNYLQPEQGYVLAKQTEPVISLSGTSFSPKFSKATSSFVFLHKSPKKNNAQVFLGYTDNTPSKALTNDAYFYMDAVFANNQVIATRFNNLKDRDCEIVNISLIGEPPSIIRPCAKQAMTKLEYANDTHTLFYNYREHAEQPYGIFALSLSDGKNTRITESSSSKVSYGDYLFNYNQQSGELAVMEHLVDGSSLLKIVNPQQQTQTSYQRFQSPSGMSWLSNQQIIVSEDTGVIMFDLSAQEKSLIDNNTDVSQLTTTNRQNTVAFVEDQYQVNIHQYEINEQQLAAHHAVTHSKAMNYKPVFANTTSSILFLAKNSQHESLYIKNNQGLVFDIGLPEPIKFYSNFVWSPDDSKILASINGKLFVKALSQKHWQQLYTQFNTIHHVTFLNKTDFIFSSKQAGSWQLWQGTSNQQDPFQLTVNGGYSSQYDDNNNHLYFTKYHIDGLYMLDLERNVEQKVDATFPLNLWDKWQIRNENLYVQKNRSIEKIALASLATIDLYDLSGVAANHFSVSRNEHLLVVDQVENSTSNIWIADVILQ